MPLPAHPEAPYEHMVLKLLQLQWNLPHEDRDAVSRRLFAELRIHLKQAEADFERIRATPGADAMPWYMLHDVTPYNRNVLAIAIDTAWPRRAPAAEPVPPEPPAPTLQPVRISFRGPMSRRIDSYTADADPWHRLTWPPAL